MKKISFLTLQKAKEIPRPAPPGFAPPRARSRCAPGALPTFTTGSR